MSNETAEKAARVIGGPVKGVEVSAELFVSKRSGRWVDYLSGIKDGLALGKCFAVEADARLVTETASIASAARSLGMHVSLRKTAQDGKDVILIKQGQPRKPRKDKGEKRDSK